tara:strand:- start:3738 stop:4106 length:369 start_codon:yes stop_codon:yes gene_type:complete
MSSYTHLVDKQHSDWLSSVAVLPKKEEPKKEKEEVVNPPFARVDSPINLDPLPVPSIMIPSISCASLEVVKKSNLSKQMKKRILELPNEMLDATEAIEEVVYLVENKKTLKKALDLVFKIEE